MNSLLLELLRRITPVFMPWLSLALFVGTWAVVFAIRYGSARQRILRKLRATKRWPISDALEGMPIRVTGRVVLIDRSLEAPLSGRACAYYLATVREEVRRQRRTSWVEHIRESEAIDFVVEDESGRARICVRPGHFKAEVTADHVSHTGTSYGNFFRPTANHAELEARVSRLLERHDVPSTGFFGCEKRFLCSESGLEPGKKVTILGTAMHWEDDPCEDAAAISSGHYRAPARRKRLVIDVGQDGNIYASDEPRLTVSALRDFEVERSS